MPFRFGGVQALAVTERDLRAAATAPPEPGDDFTRFFPAAQWKQATDELRLAFATAPAELSEAASCALCCLACSVGSDAGFVTVPVEEDHAFAPFARTWLPRMLRSPDAYERALEAGVAGVKGTGRFAFGHLTGRQLRVAEWSTYEPPDGEIVAARGDEWIEAFVDAFSNGREMCTDGRVLLFVPHWVDVQQPEEEAPPPPPPAPALPLDELLAVAVARGASDLVFTVGLPPQLRIAGELSPTEHAPLDAEAVPRALYLVLTEEQKARFEKDGRLIFSFGVAGLARFRATYWRQRGVMAGSMRVLPLRPPSWTDTGLPDGVADLRRGIVAIAGAAGAGRTVIAHALVARIAETSRRHVLTIEEPLELVHGNGQGVVTQIDVGSDIPTFADALAVARAAAPDVVMLDRMDPPERFEAACELARDGRLVIATLAARDVKSSRARVPKDLLAAVVVVAKKPAVWPAMRQSKRRRRIR